MTQRTVAPVRFLDGLTGTIEKVLAVTLQERFSLMCLLLLGVGIRVIGITQPFVDGWSWRQADGAMIAENFYRHGFNIWFPQINWAGAAPGYVGTEFPLVPFVASLGYLLFGVHEWIGRAISVAFFVASVLFVFLLVKMISTARAGLLAATAYTLTPLSVWTGRSFMPDMASLSFSLAAIYLFSTWLRRAPHRPLFLAASLTTSLAILIKAPAVIIGLPLLYLAWQIYGARVFRQRALWGFATLSLVPALMWYVHAYLISTTYYPYHMFGEGGLRIMDVTFYMDILRWMIRRSFTPLLFGAMLLGVLLPSRVPFGHVFHWWFVAILVFTVFAGHGSRHSWYQLPLVPVAAAFTGLILDRAARRVARLGLGEKSALAITCVLFFVPFGTFSYFSLKPQYHSSRAIQFWQAGQILDQIALPDALILAADYGDPALIYYSRRKGWHFPEISQQGHPPLDGQNLIRELEARRNEGARYLILTRSSFRWFKDYPDFHAHLVAQYRRLKQTEVYLIFDLAGVSPESRV